MPKALSIGVPYDTFGMLNPKKLEPFYDSFKLIRDRKLDEINYGAWLHGLYHKAAVVAAFNTDASYPDKPLDLTAKGSNPEVLISETANKAIQFSAWADMYNERVIKQQEGQ